MTSQGPASPESTVGIVGTFDVENYGDLLFPLIAEAELVKRVPGLKLTAYSPTSPQGPWPFPVKPAGQLQHEISGMSALLIGGGQLVRFDDRYPITLPEGMFAPDAYFLDPALAAIGAGVPLVWNAIGAWSGSPRCPARDAVLGKLIERSAISGVRDQATRELFERLAPDAKVESVPDTAFGLSDLWPFAADASAQRQWRETMGLAGPYMVIQADVRLVRHMDQLTALQQRLGLPAVVLPVCRCHGDRAEHIPALSLDTDRQGGWQSPHRIREIIAGAELVVASSLHASITALSYGIRVIRVPLHRERKFELLDGFEGICRLDDTAGIERLLARANGIEPRVREHQARLAAYWDQVAQVVQGPVRKAADLRPEGGFPPVRQLASLRARAVARQVRDGVRAQWPVLRALPRPPAWRGQSILDLAAIRNARIETSPFRWSHQSGLFAPADAARLAAEFPTRGFWTIEGVEKDRHYSFTARSLVAMGAHRPTAPGSLSDAWQAFALDLLAPDYRQAMSELVGIDLSRAPMEANITQYGQGHELSPHLDLKEKLVTQIFYFNTGWTEGDGGCLEILGGRDARAGLASLAPHVGTAAVLVRSHNSWHRVTPVRDGINRPRRSLNVIFHLPGSRSTMWPQWPVAGRRALKRLLGREPR